MTTSDPFQHDDAAYVLGALSEPEHEAFEAHLVTCAACTLRVNTLTAVPKLLADITAGDLAKPAAESEPDTLLPGLLRRAASARRRQRWLVTGLGGLAAACLIALAVTVWPSAPASDRPHPQAMTALTASPVQATAALIDHKWGTQIDLDCYATSYAGSARVTYSLQLIDRHGTAHELGTWTLEPGGETTFTSGTALPRDQISSLQITRANGTTILHLST